MTNNSTDTPRTDAAAFGSMTHSWELEQLSQKELAASEAEVERLKEMVMEAARKGDELLEPYRLRAEKAETLLNQIHAFVETLNPNKK